ncbi:MAG: hypothetical protein QOH91_2241 [Mycobacterium sp.]|nr:hypothetical protein [Mycobacterium sp.]
MSIEWTTFPEGLRTGQTLVQHTRQRINVGAGISGAGGKPLRGDINPLRVIGGRCSRGCRDGLRRRARRSSTVRFVTRWNPGGRGAASMDRVLHLDRVGILRPVIACQIFDALLAAGAPSAQPVFRVGRTVGHVYHHYSMLIAVHGGWMRTTLALDDDLVREAQRLTGTNEKSALVREALRALIERESARRLARLGGTEPSATAIPRRRPASA